MRPSTTSESKANLHISSNSLSERSGDNFTNVVVVLAWKGLITFFQGYLFCKSLKPGVFGEKYLWLHNQYTVELNDTEIYNLKLGFGTFIFTNINT